MRTQPETRARSSQEAGKRARKLSRYKANQACNVVDTQNVFAASHPLRQRTKKSHVFSVHFSPAAGYPATTNAIASNSHVLGAVE